MLSKRLFAISEMIQPNETVLDVGTDHALLPCFLVQTGKCEKVYASDIGDGPIEKAKSNVKKLGLEEKVLCYKANGLEKKREDVNCVVISGMGYYTVEEILKDQDLKGIRFIVQINKHVPLLRQYLSDHHYTILDECVVEDGFFYEIISFNSEYHESYDDLEIRFGPINLKKRSDEFIDHLKNQCAILKNIDKTAGKPLHQKEISLLDSLINGTL